MVLRTTTYNILAVQELIEHDKELRRGERRLAVESLVVHHGDRRWNAPTRLRDLFPNSALDTYRVVERLPPYAPPQGALASESFAPLGKWGAKDDRGMPGQRVTRAGLGGDRGSAAAHSAQGTGSAVEGRPKGPHDPGCAPGWQSARHP